MKRYICYFSLAILVSAGPRIQTLHSKLAVDSSLLETKSRHGASFFLKTKAAEPKCHDKKVVDSSSDKWLECPAACPVYADNRGDGVDCNFECVEAEPKACIAVNPHEPIPDKDMGICRACIIDGCEVCTTEGEDTCAKCQKGFTLTDGKCTNNNQYYWYALFACVGCGFLTFVAWMVELFMRPDVNTKELQRALNARTQAKILQPRQGNEPRQVYSAFTNLMKEAVGGVGMQLHFNFQAVIIWWAFAVAVAWAILAYTTDDALFILGTRRAKTARQNCILVAWGYETQQRLMWTKIDFMAGLYIATFIMAIIFGIRQLRIFQKVDLVNSTHKDFAARIRNLPHLAGDQKVEEMLKATIQDKTEQKVVGVSVCWDFQKHEDDVMELLESQLVEREIAAESPQIEDSVGEEPAEPMSIFARFERSVLLPNMVGDANKIVVTGEASEAELQQARDAENDEEGDEIAEVKEVDVIEILKTIKTCADGYVVFETEEARDAAVDKANELQGIEFEGNMITLNACRVEPSSIQWPNCANTNLWFKAKRVMMGVGVIGLGLAVWVICFYLPYAWFSLTFNYSYGREPGALAGITFSMVVVAGNLLMYQVCSMTAINARFIYVDDREVCYMLCYCFACTFNVILDLVCTYMVAYRINVGLRMKTYDGTLLDNVQTFSGRFETYAMQRLLANNLWAYAFPSTFLIGFLIEPVACFYVPYKIATKIIGSQPKIRGFMAEKLLPALIIGTEFDLSRYADILLNVMITVLIFFFPGGFNIQMFGALGICHIIIYALDQIRVIKCVQCCEYADRMVDFWAQWVLTIPTGLLLSCLVFKANCQEGYFCLDDGPIVQACVAAFFCHIILHSLCLKFVVPRFGLTDSSSGTSVSYRSVSERLAPSFFSTNPIFCLRSKYFYKHEPACTFYSAGKEHLMEVNEKEGFYFADEPAMGENWDYMGDIKTITSDSLQQLKGHTASSVSGHMETIQGHMDSIKEQTSGHMNAFQGHMDSLKEQTSGHMNAFQGHMDSLKEQTSAQAGAFWGQMGNLKEQVSGHLDKFTKKEDVADDTGGSASDSKTESK